MTHASPTEGTTPILICVYGAVPDAGGVRPADLPAGIAVLRVLTASDASSLSVSAWPVSTALDFSQAAALQAAANHAPAHDIVLIAADADLPPHWWPRLRAAMAAAPDHDVIGAMDRGLPEFDALSREGLDAACWSLSERQLVPVNEASPVFSVWRAQTLSFDAKFSKATLPLVSNLATLDHLFVTSSTRPCPRVAPPALRALANRVGEASPALGRLPYYGLDGRDVVLHVLHGWGGGAQRFVQDLSAGDDQRHHLVLIARGDSGRTCHGETLSLHADAQGPALRLRPLSAPIASTVLRSDEYTAHLKTIMSDYGVGAVLVSSLIGHSLDALRSGLPTAVVCHDYYPLWPRLHADFGDANLDFSPAAIDAALARPGSDFEFAETRPAAWRALRAAYVSALEHANARLIAPTAGVLENLDRIEPALRQLPRQRIEHGLADWPEPVRIDADPARRALRLVVPGRIRGHKGEALLAELIPQLPDDAELVLLGGGAAAMRFFGQRGVHVLLDYRRDQFPDLLAQLRPDAALLLSTVAETYSYLLSELWSLRIPVIATRLGSFAERITPDVDGLLVEPNGGDVARLLTRLQRDRSVLAALRERDLPPLPSLTDMAAAYRSALPTRTTALASPEAVFDARRGHFEEESAKLAASLADSERRLSRQQKELERRADWAYTQEKLARERTAWALTLETDNQTLIERCKALDAEVEARGRWAQSLIAEGEQLKETIVSEQRRLEAEIEYERGRLMEVLNSASWRLTKPLRWTRRKLSAALARLVFQSRRVASALHRLRLSLKTRGVIGTVDRIRQEFHSPQPSMAFVLPAADLDALPTLTWPESPRASVIVPVYNHFHHTRTCLHALAACGDTTPFEVIVVDDGSSDETQERLATLAGIRFHRNAQNLGFIGACNAGAKLARSEFLIFLNNDTAVQRGWLDALLQTFEQHDHVGLAGSKLVYPDGRLQEAGGIVFSDASGWNYGRFDDPADPRYNFVREVDYCSGAAIAIRKSLFDQFGGFDSHYAPAYYEDTDLAMKVRQAGLRVLYQPASVVVHFEGVTSGTDTAGSGTKRFQVVNQQKFLERWRETLASHPTAGTDIAIARQHRARKRVLIIDATTPQSDHDSGSLRLVNAMRVMRAEGFAITFFADNRAWIERYTAELQQLGVEVLWHPWLSDPVRWFAENGRRFDLVFVSRHYIASSYVGLVRLHAPQARLVFDTVDLHYLREQREAELSGREDQRQTAAITRSKELALIRSSDITLVVSPVEQELLRREAPGARVEVLSNVHEVFGRRRDFADRKDMMFMGGYQHPPNVDAALWFVREVFPLVRARLPDATFHLLGSKANDAVRALGEIEGVQFHGFVEDIEPFLDGCRLAVAPLRYGAGVKGKVNMSMSYGQPVIATPIAIEGMHAEAGRDVLVAESPQAFADAIVQAYGDQALWTSLSDHGLANVERHFSFDAARAAVRKLFE